MLCDADDSDRIDEGDIARRKIQQINADRFKFPQQRLDCRPTTLELLSFVRFPIGPNILRKLGPNIEVCAREIQDEWPFDDSHFNDPQLILEPDQLRDIEPEQGGHSPLSIARKPVFRERKLRPNEAL